MSPTLRHWLALAAWLATASNGWAQDVPLPTGNWRSPSPATFTNPGMTGASLYLNIDVAKDGSFKGTWGSYFCTTYPGVYGIFIYSCTVIQSRRASGRFSAGRRGEIVLDELGRSAFTWSAPAPDELAVDLPKNWQGSDEILYRARMTRDGKVKPPADAKRDEGPLLSGPALYREFGKDEKGALARHGGRPLVLEGRRGNVIALSSGGAAIHVPDGTTVRALVLYFRDAKEVAGLAEGAPFRFRCTVMNFDYQYLQMDNCSVVR